MTERLDLTTAATQAESTGPSPFEVRVLQLRNEVLTRQVSDLSAQSSQLVAECHAMREMVQALQQELATVKGEAT